MRTHTIAVLLATLLGGCGGVVSKHPASDEATTRSDERLVGFWRMDADATPGAKTDPNVDESIIVVARKPGSERALDLAIVTLRRDKTLDLTRGDLLATTIGEKDTASVRLGRDGEKAAEDATWGVLRYQMPDGDTLRVLSMDEKAVAADVRAAKIAGSVAESEGPPGAEPTLTVTIDAPTPALRAYLEQRGDAIYRADRPLVLRRVRAR